MEGHILELAKRFDSFYLYDGSGIHAAADKLQQDIPHAGFLYSVKANPHPEVLKTVFAAGLGADAASLAEVQRCIVAGLAPEHIYYSAPGKTDSDLAQALGSCVIIADSLGEIYRLDAIAQAGGRREKIGVRINPDFTFYSSAGASSKFGVDEALLLEAADALRGLANIQITGIHVHLRSQELSGEVLKNYYQNMFSLARRLQERLQVDFEFINLGSGIGIPYSPEQQGPDTALLGREISALCRAFEHDFKSARILIETGRYVVCQSGIYASKVVDVKTSYGTKYAILHSTMNAFIRPSLAQMVATYAQGGEVKDYEPLFTRVDANAFYVVSESPSGTDEKVTLAGSLCTGADVVAKNVLLPALAVGDMVVMTNAGSYAAVLSPVQFASLTPPAEVFLDLEGRLVV